MLRKGVSVRKLRILIILVVVFGVIGAGGWVVVKKRAAAGKKGTVVRVEPAQPTELLEFVSAPAELEPYPSGPVPVSRKERSTRARACRPLAERSISRPLPGTGSIPTTRSNPAGISATPMM